jgi:hypothetical protein
MVGLCLLCEVRVCQLLAEILMSSRFSSRPCVLDCFDSSYFCQNRRWCDDWTVIFFNFSLEDPEAHAGARLIKSRSKERATRYPCMRVKPIICDFYRMSQIE